jgi:DNA-binding beta-propeller fold protein YncE
MAHFRPWRLCVSQYSSIFQKIQIVIFSRGHTPGVFARRAVLLVPILALLNTSCQRDASSFPPKHYLLITHSALNRITIFDLTLKKIVGALPTQKLPHDMLVSRDRVLYVVNSGAQCITTYDLKKPELWEYAQEFMRKDSANLFAARTPSPNMSGRGQTMGGGRSDKDTAAWTNLNRDPVQSLPASFAHTFLTDPHFPDAALPVHMKAGALSHSTCYDCHDRSVGAKPFGPTFSRDSSEIFLVHLGYRKVTFLDAKTLAVKRQIPLPIPAQYSPIEAWIAPDQITCFVTCRNEIGESRPGLILVLDLRDGAVIKSITAGIYPWHLIADPTHRRLYVNNFQSSRISIVDVEKREIVDSLVVQNGPSMMKLLPERDLLAVSCFYTDRVLFVDLKTKAIMKSVEVDANPTSLELSPDGRTMTVLCGGESSLNVVDIAEGKVKEKYKMLFGAYAFHSVDEQD